MNFKYYLVIIFCLTTIISCEKDDICSESTLTTPRLIITFKDVADPDQSKAVESLGVYAIVNNEMILLDGINGTTDSIAIPLNNGDEFSHFKFYKDFTNNDVISGISNDIYINHSNSSVYISRACGFSNNFIITSFFNYNPNNDQPEITWVSEYEIVNSLVSNENQSHVEILH
jgi:hypothetical protein